MEDPGRSGKEYSAQWAYLREAEASRERKRRRRRELRRRDAENNEKLRRMAGMVKRR